MIEHAQRSVPGIDRPDGHLVQRLLELFFELVYHPDLSGNPSAASIYFALKEGVYTILIDEVDRNESHKEAVLDLLNFSHFRRTAFVSRGDPEKGVRVKYATFCPKIIGGNGSIRVWVKNMRNGKLP